MGDSGSRGGGGKSRGVFPQTFPVWSLLLLLLLLLLPSLLGDPSHPLSLPVAPCIDLIVNKWRPLTFEQCGQAQGRDTIAPEERCGVHNTLDTACSICPLVHLRREDGIRLILAVSPPWWGRMPCRLTSRKVTYHHLRQCTPLHVSTDLQCVHEVWLHTIM